MKGKVARFARNGDATVKLHVPFQCRMNLVVFAAFFADKGTALSVNGLDMAREGTKHVERLATVVAMMVLGSLGRHVTLSDVRIERSLCVKVGSTSVADVGFLPCVSSHVVEEHRLLSETFIALRALEPQLMVHVLVLVLQAVGSE